MTYTATVYDWSEDGRTARWMLLRDGEEIARSPCREECGRNGDVAVREAFERHVGPLRMVRPLYGSRAEGHMALELRPQLEGRATA